MPNTRNWIDRSELPADHGANRMADDADRWVREDIAERAVELCRVAASLGFAIAITQKPQQPLAMGNYAPQVEVWKLRALAVPK